MSLIQMAGGALQPITYVLFQYKYKLYATTKLDVWITRDGQVVVFHDPDLTRMTGGNSQATLLI